MKRFHTKWFGADQVTQIDEWLNSFFKVDVASTKGSAYAGEATVEGYVVVENLVVITISRYEYES